MRRPLPYHMPSKGEPFLGFFLVFFFSQLSAICFYALIYRLFHLFGAVFLAVPAPAKREYIHQHISVFVGIWIFARTLIQEGIIQSPKAGSFITTVLSIIGAGLMIFFLFSFFF